VGFQGCGTSISYMYFLIYIIIVSMLVLNLAIAAVIDGLAQAQADDSRLVKNDDIDLFMDTWAFYDPKGKGKISIVDILFFIVDLKPPFGDCQHHRIPIMEGMQLDGYLVNMPRGYCVRWKSMFQIIKEYKLKATKNSEDQYFVAFTDIYKEFIKKAFEKHYSNNFKVDNENLKQKLKKGWKKSDNKIDKNVEIII
jgi:hypothetical protein